VGRGPSARREKAADVKALSFGNRNLGKNATVRRGKNQASFRKAGYPFHKDFPRMKGGVGKEKKKRLKTAQTITQGRKKKSPREENGM